MGNGISRTFKKVFGGGEQQQVRESEGEKATQEVAYKGWQRQKRVGIPEQNKLIREFQKMDDPGQLRSRQGKMVASVTSGMPGPNPAQFNPNGNFGRAAVAQAMQRSQAGGQALTQGRESGENARREGLRSMAALATGTQNRGLRGASQQAMADQAKQMGQINNKAADGAMAGSIAGTLMGWGANKLINR